MARVTRRRGFTVHTEAAFNGMAYTWNGSALKNTWFDCTNTRTNQTVQFQTESTGSYKLQVSEFTSGVQPGDVFAFVPTTKSSDFAIEVSRDAGSTWTTVTENTWTTLTSTTGQDMRIKITANNRARIKKLKWEVKTS